MHSKMPSNRLASALVAQVIKCVTKVSIPQGVYVVLITPSYYLADKTIWFDCKNKSRRKLNQLL